MSTLAEVVAYLDHINPTAPAARKTSIQVVNAPDSDKLRVLNDGIASFQDKLGTWIQEGFEGFHLAAGAVQPSVKLAEAESSLRSFLESRIGHQLVVNQEANTSIFLTLWEFSTEAPHLCLIWWMAEASESFGCRLLKHPGDSEDDEPDPSDADMLSAIDPDCLDSWTPPRWLRRIPDFYGKYERSPSRDATPAEVLRELRFFHHGVWETVEHALKAARLKIIATTQPSIGAEKLVPTRATKTKPRPPSLEMSAYKLVYEAAGCVNALYAGKAKLGKEFLARICSELDAQKTPVPKQANWQSARNWSEALKVHKVKVKAYIYTAVKRYHGWVQAEISAHTL